MKGVGIYFLLFPNVPNVFICKIIGHCTILVFLINFHCQHSQHHGYLVGLDSSLGLPLWVLDLQTVWDKHLMTYIRLQLRRGWLPPYLHSIKMCPPFQSWFC